MPIVGLVITCLLTVFIVGGMAFHIFRSLRDGVIHVNQNQIFPDFTCSKAERPFIYWALMAVYAAILIGVAAALAGTIILARSS